MPHLTLEYSANITEKLDVRGVLSELHELLAEMAGIPIENFKGRAIRLDDYAIGADRGDAAFVHLTIRLFGGRATELKQRIGQASLDLLKRSFEPVHAGQALQISIEFVDIDRDSYVKFMGV